MVFLNRYYCLEIAKVEYKFLLSGNRHSSSMDSSTIFQAPPQAAYFL